MGSSGFTSRNKSHTSTGGGKELQGGRDERIKKKLRCTHVQSKEDKESEGLEHRDKGKKKMDEISEGLGGI